MNLVSLADIACLDVFSDVFYHTTPIVLAAKSICGACATEMSPLRVVVICTYDLIAYVVARGGLAHPGL